MNTEIETLRFSSKQDKSELEEIIKNLRGELSEINQSRSREESESSHQELAALKEEVERYRVECVSLAAKLSRAEALARRSNK